jgi:hypothetical protein
MGDVIDFKSRSKAVSNPEKDFSQKLAAAEVSQVIDITSIRSKTLQEDRRKVRRTLLTEFIAVHTLVPGMGLMKVALFDINKEGMAFDIDSKKGHFRSGEEVAMRVYLNAQTYFPFICKIKHVTEITDEEVHRHGSEFVKGTINDVALNHFIAFIETISANLKSDKGDVLVSNINS